MALDSASYPAETLLGHQEFVRKLARSLLRDDDAAQDVEQETWLVALRHAPRSIESMQAWLGAIVRNRAHNRRRENERRAARELISARREADDSDEVLRDRVALAHDVVQAVLALREPYRAIVILRYYENLSPRQIAARKNILSGTVRVQLSRAHELLRAKLDAQRGGDRASWSVALAALAGKPAAGISALNTAILATGCAVAIGVPLWMWLHEPPAPASMSAGIIPLSRVDAPTEVAEAEERSIEEASTREPIAQAAAATQASIDPELASKSVRELLELAVQTQRTIRTKLLTPDERFVREQASLLRLPETGLARILERGKFGTDDSNALGIRGGGSCYSFVTHKQSWSDEPDLALDQGFLRPQGMQSFLVDLGEHRLEDLPNAAAPIPFGLDDAGRAAWELGWTDARPNERGVDAGFEAERRKMRAPNKPKVGRTYLLRALDHRTHDLLVAFTLLHQDETGCTISWRVLHTWPTSGNLGTSSDPYWWVAEAPPSIATRDVDSLLRSLGELRAAARARLFATPADVAQRFESALSMPQSGVARLLSSDRYQALLEGAGGGAYFSFANGTGDRDAADLVLTSYGYGAGSLGSDRGFLLDVGITSIATIGEPLEAPRDDISPRDQDRWRFLAACPSPAEGPRGAPLSNADDQRANQLHFARWIRPERDHTCLIRSMLPGKHDVLAAFTTAAVDDEGTWIVWRVLRNRSLRDEAKPR